MSPAIGGRSGNKIHHIVQIRQMLKGWRRMARVTAARYPPSDVPAGHVAVIVGSGCRRYVVRASHLNHPVFQKLLAQSEEEYGFAGDGPLCFPCDESCFEEVLRFASRVDSASASARFCHVDIVRRLDNLGVESRPLLRDLADRSMIC